MCLVNMRVFFFSSRRRHTRLQGDWSSDVCSSDLGSATIGRASSRCDGPRRRRGRFPTRLRRAELLHARLPGLGGDDARPVAAHTRVADRKSGGGGEEGRSRWAADHLKKKKKKKET